MILIGFLSLMLSSSWGQTGAQSKDIESHTGGLNNYESSNRLNDDETPSVVNAFLDKDNAVVKRSGYQLYGSIAGCTTGANGGWSFKDSNGNNYFVVYCNKQLYYTKGDGSFSVLGATVTSINPVRARVGLSKIWFTDGIDNVTSWDGTLISSVSAAPLAKLIGVFKNRLVFANYPAAQSQVLLSEYNNGASYTVPAVQQDTSPVIFPLNGTNDGRAVTCMYDGFRDVLILWNEDQMFGLYGNGVNTFVLRVLSQNVGCVEQETVQEYNGKLRWLSKLGVMEFNGSNTKVISEPIKTVINSVISTEKSVQALVQTSQADWQAANLTAAGAGAPMSATISPGDVVPGTWTVTDQTPTNFNSGVMSGTTVTVSGILQSTAIFSNIGFEQNIFGNWTKSGAGATQDLIINGSSVCGNASTGTFTWGGAYSLLDDDGGAVNFSNTVFVELVRASDNLELARVDLHSLNVNGECDLYSLNTSAAAGNRVKIRFFDNASGPGPTLASQAFDESELSNHTLYFGAQVVAAGQYGCQHFGVCTMVDFPEPYFIGQTTFTSQCFDTSFSTPTWGYITSSTSGITNSTYVNFFTSVSSSCNGQFTTWSPATNGVMIPSISTETIEYRTVLISQSTTTPSINSVTLVAATTGQVITNCFNPGAMSAWDVFQANTVSNGASITFQVSTGTACDNVLRSTANWVSQANNSLITIDTAPFIGVRATLTSISTGVINDPRLQDITINFTAGSSRPPAASAVYDNRYWLAFTTNTAPGSFNNSVYVYDSRDHWSYLNDINAGSLWIYRRRLYSGQANGGAVYLQDEGTTDAGGNIPFLFQTPFYNLDNWSTVQLYDLHTEAKTSGDPTLTSNVNVGYYVDGSTTEYSLGSYSENGYIPDFVSTFRFGLNGAPVTAKRVSIQYDDNSVAPVTIYRSLIRFDSLGLQ